MALVQHNVDRVGVAFPLEVDYRNATLDSPDTDAKTFRLDHCLDLLGIGQIIRAMNWQVCSPGQCNRLVTLHRAAISFTQSDRMPFRHLASTLLAHAVCHATNNRPGKYSSGIYGREICSITLLGSDHHGFQSAGLSGCDWPHICCSQI